MEERTASYYAIIPAEVRYDKELKANEKLLYAELSALANKEGYCWPTNHYLAKLYGVHKNTVGKWINELERSGYIRTELILDGKQVVERRIYVVDFLNKPNRDTNEKNDTPDNKRVETPLNENIEENNTRVNTTRLNNKEYIQEIFDLWNDQQIVTHRNLTNEMVKAIEKAVKGYGADQVMAAILLYSHALDEQDFYYKHYWVLEKFLRQRNGIGDWIPGEGQRALEFDRFLNQPVPTPLGGESVEHY